MAPLVSELPNLSGTVEVCFGDETLSKTSGILTMKVKGLEKSVTGGVHIHSGTSCESSATQEGHYFKNYPSPTLEYMTVLNVPFGILLRD